MTSYSIQDKKIIGIITILSGILALGCLITGMVAVNYDFDAFANPAKLLGIPQVSITAIRWFMLLDMFGYYLLLLPVVFYAHHKFKLKTAWAFTFSSLAFAYIMIGAIGAAVLSVVWPSILESYNHSSAASQEVQKINFLLFTDFIVKAMWNLLEIFLAGVWWLSVGYFIVEQRGLKILTMILGASAIIDGFGELFQLPLVAETGLNLYLILAIVWPVWIGIAMLKNKF